MGPWLRDLEGVVWWWGERRSILKFLSRLLLEKFLIGMAFHPKEVSMARATLIHAIGVSVVEASNLYSLKVRQKWGKEEIKQGILSGNGEGCIKHTLSRGSGRPTNGLVGKPREMLTRNQKRLVKP